MATNTTIGRVRLGAAVLAACAFLVQADTVAHADATPATGIGLQTAAAPSAQLAYGTLVQPTAFIGSFEVVLVNPIGGVGSPALGPVDTTRPWASITESRAPGAWSLQGGAACQNVGNVSSWTFANAMRVGAPVAAVDLPCNDGRGYRAYHVEWDYLNTPAAGGTGYPEWGSLANVWGYLLFGQVNMVETTLKICGIPEQSGPWTCASSVEPLQVYLAADNFSSVTIDAPLGI